LKLKKLKARRLNDLLKANQIVTRTGQKTHVAYNGQRGKAQADWSQAPIWGGREGGTGGPFPQIAISTLVSLPLADLLQ
jgi:hypothetical protein